MRKLITGAVLTLLLVSISAVPGMAETTIDESQAPQGAHISKGTPNCFLLPGNVTVQCGSVTIVGIGKTNATTTLSAVYSATFDCLDESGNVVTSVREPTQTATGQPSPENGRITTPILRSSVPSGEDFIADGGVSCPGGTTPQIVPDSLTVDSFTYTVSFDGFTGNYIKITV
jgi:hypothetical protein